ncbi:MAG: preprotein translocase subunit SecA [Alphaproteobacteria bacterium]|nr:preprotein translocase subunit SecA [Alphaproteobacteria bacterium]
MQFLRKIFPTKNDKFVKNLKKIVQTVNALEPEMMALKDEDFPQKTAELREKIKQGASRKDILDVGFALVREAAKRALNMRHFDVQIMGGIVLFDGKVAEMATGEGKTLVATLPAYVVALEGFGAHIVTVNDYLAKRDAEWMGQIFEFLGMTVGIIQSGMSPEERSAQYACDITYVTNNELGFDYLRDNMRSSLEQKVLRVLHFALVDEVDSILIDEARTPLIISGPTDKKEDLCHLANKVVLNLKKEHYDIDEKGKSTSLTEEGMSFVEQFLKNAGVLDKEASLYDIENSSLVHFITQSLKAHRLFSKNKDYIVRDKKVHIIDEFTGRIMDGRRFSDNLHQAIEAKEGVAIQQENQTLASITYQNLFRMYKTLSGMSGTVMTESVEFQEIYKLSCVALPTNRPLMREDRQDLLYATFEEKAGAILAKIKECQKKGQPVLLGTVSIEKSEAFARILRKEKIPHNVLNAKNHTKEASIIASAGSVGAVTIATNMAGRGTDIKLGGNMDFYVEGMRSKKELLQSDLERIEKDFSEKKSAVLVAGGLCIIGTERHESRRIDNQLRGRAGRQGDVGESVFYLCMEDDLMRIFAGDKMQFLMSQMKSQKGEPIEHKLITKSIERAQGRVEAQNYEIRKHLLNYDNVSNKQREMIYSMRRDLLDDEKPLLEIVEDHMHEAANMLLEEGFPGDELSPERVQEFVGRVSHIFRDERMQGLGALSSVSLIEKSLFEILCDKIIPAIKVLDSDQSHFVAYYILSTIDNNWRQHLARIDHLKQGVNLRSYAQGNPLVEFKKEAFDLFLKLLSMISLEVSSVLFNHLQDILKHSEARSAPSLTPPASRNAPCPCGSDKKYKHCHGKI